MSRPFRLEGCWTAMTSPFLADGSSLDLGRWEHQLRFQAAGGVRGVVPCGTTGEAPTLEMAEQRTLIEKAVEVAKPLGLGVIGGAGSNSTRHAVELHRMVAATGADAALHVAPYYNKPSQEGIYRHFMAIADACDLPIVLYSIPGRCGVAILPETVERLARHPNIVAIKEATGCLDSASEIRRRCALPILSGDDSLTIGFQSVGAIGVVSVVSNLVPDRVQALVDACNRNDFDSARATHEQLLPLAKGLLSLDVNPVPVKTAMAMLGRDSGSLRLPLCEPSDAVKRQIGELLKAQGLTAAAQAVHA
jgi:4-hydroxy-tetrahydrodipicolinate synthase